MPKANRICKTDETAYYYCNTCPDDRRPKWYTMFCCERCKSIFDTLLNNFLGKETTQNTYAMLESLGAINDDSLSNSIKDHIAKVVKTYTEENEARKIVLQEQVLSEEESVIDVAATIIDTELAPAKIIYKPRKRSNKNSEVIDNTKTE